MALYGIYGSHTAESCPLNNAQSRKIVLGNAAKGLETVAHENKVKLLEQYHSALEHTFIWTTDSENAHSVERFLVESGWSAFNTVKIVPLGTYQDLVGACKKIGS